MKVYIVIELHEDNVPKILGVFKKKNKAEEIAYIDHNTWRNIIEQELK